VSVVLHSAPKSAGHDGLAERFAAALGADLVEAAEAHGELSLTVARDRIADVLRMLRDEHGYQQLMEIAGVDYPDRPERFEVVYHLLSLTANHRLRVRVTTDEDTPVPTATTVWPNAGWLEREVFDMYGVLFAGHPDLRRILTDYGFKGHPFRKDFPLTGHVEMRWSEEAKRVIYEPVELAQDFRSFDFTSPWEGPDYVLPGDEKGDAPKPATPPVDKPKTTDTPAHTGAGAATDAKAAKTVSDGAPVAHDAVRAPDAPDKTKGGA
jgi:NADH-quinone oxidoreductase subunit C